MPQEQGLARPSRLFGSAPLSVSELNRSVRDLLEHRFPLLWVRGEISNCTVARSGHVYFALKDSGAQLRCVMFRSRADGLGWNPCDGVEVEVQGLVTLYEAKGDFQFIVESMRRGGRGALFESFHRLKEKLELEGLFDAGKKRPMPFLPRTIGVVTSPHAAALRDVLTTLRRRNPSTCIIIYPTPVQGDAAAAAVVRSLRRAAARNECDALIVCRGGGSIEDLWCFNHESVARAIRACPMPVVTGIGHETDFTIADFAADHRAPTPTGAAELVSPLRAELLGRARELARRLGRRVEGEFQVRAQTVDHLSRRLAHPAERLRNAGRLLGDLRERLHRALARCVEHRSVAIGHLVGRMRQTRPDLVGIGQRIGVAITRLTAAMAARLEHERSAVAAWQQSLTHLSPQAVLARGYSLVRDADGHIVTDSRTLTAGSRLSLRFSAGSARALVEEIDPDPA